MMKRQHKPMSTFRKLVLAIAILLTIIVVSVILRYASPLIIEKEKVVIINQPSLERLKDFILVNAELHLTLDKDLILQSGEFESCRIYIWGPWDRNLTFTNCIITHSSIYIENMAVYAENCTITDSSFNTEIEQCCVLIKGNRFSGSVQFNINVVNEGGNIGLENVVFNKNVTTPCSISAHLFF